jgi:hypothetical protein
MNSDFDQLVQLFKGLDKRLKVLERTQYLPKITIPTEGYFVVDIQTSDPTTVQNGRVFYNSTLNAFRVGVNGAWKTMTVS